jgi:hypothetical protein
MNAAVCPDQLLSRTLDAKASVDLLLVLQHSDLMALTTARHRFASTRLLFVDPGFLDEAAAQGLENLRFLGLETGPDFQARAASEAFALASLLDLRLTRERERLWPGLAMSGWDVGPFFLALQRMVVARQLGERIRDAVDEPRIGLLRPSLTQQMYFDSFLSADLVRAAAPDRFVFVAGYDQVMYRRPAPLGYVFESCRLRHAMAGGRVSLLTHLPTCFYNQDWLAAEVTRAHDYTIDLPSPLWDVPVHRGHAPVVAPQEAPAADRAQADLYRARAREVLAEVLSPMLPDPAGAALQLDDWADRSGWQALNYLALREGLEGARPDLLVADQDVGLNGPLFSVADYHGLEIMVVPHSGHPSMVVPHGRRVTVVEHAGYGTLARSVLGQAVPVRAVRMQPGPKRKARGSVRTVCLMLNAMQTEGLSQVDMPALAAFYRQLAEVCRERDVKLMLRPKPNSPAVNVLSRVLDEPTEIIVSHVRTPLADIAEASDLCVVFGEPTTGVAPFLDSGCPVLQVCSQRWPTDYLVCTPLIEQGVIPMVDPEPAIARILEFIAVPERYLEFAGRQSEDFDRRARGAHDHLFNLKKGRNPC